MLNKKIDRMKKIEEMENIILELEDWHPQMKSKILEDTFGNIEDIETRDKLMEFVNENLMMIKNETIDDDKLYLAEIVKIEKPVFKKNNLILAPVGSGKSTLIEEILLKNQTDEILMLVSNTTLKNSICPEDDEIRKEQGKRMYTSQNKKKFGNKPYSVYVMSYAEFGAKIRFNDNFTNKFTQIYCDEIHSLIDYQEFSNSIELAIAIKYLFNPYDDKQLFYFTATNQSLLALQKRHPNLLENVLIFDYLKHPNIKQYMALSEYKINHIAQIGAHLKARLKSFNYFGYKCLAFNKTIEGMKKIEEIAIEEGFRPISLWSVNNKDEQNQMNEEQLRVREYLLTHGEIPEPYNFLIINSAMQEGWNLYDSKIKLAIMNTTNETEHIQALGRNRNDIDILIYRVKSKVNKDMKTINLEEKWLDKSLTTQMKDELCQELNLINSRGELTKWTTVNKLLKEQGYTIIDRTINIDKKRARVSIISKNKNS